MLAAPATRTSGLPAVHLTSQGFLSLASAIPIVPSIPGSGDAARERWPDGRKVLRSKVYGEETIG